MASNANLIRVYVRARPLLKNEKSQKIDEKFLSLDGTHVELQNILRKKSQYIDNIQSKFQFTVDSTFDAEATNQQVFNQTTRPLIERVLDGYNGTVFCYGATNSGKTHTMIGKLQSEINQNAIGLYTQAAEMIFQRVNETSQQRIYLVSASFIEKQKKEESRNWEESSIIQISCSANNQSTIY
ncbi:MAG: hypothetical protein EZS28_008614 [Streblomastix strix]|uniref:Kinesin motor domain-containing protein n=1 Tax=Streblomastix strix TaxID=222440 RepID=A0A5J4WNT2_9EUKA|nr:MAG: hypothetical protein EZS28_008614 [Streblomastix strix]